MRHLIKTSLFFFAVWMTVYTRAAITPDTIRVLRQMTQQQEAYSNVPIACPEINLPSITGSKAKFRYIDAGCQESLTITPAFGVSGGTITDYNVQSIPYAPPFKFDQGTKIFINSDDVWGDIIDLPFGFCFYNHTYYKAVVAANGIVSFNTSVANYSSGYSLTDYPNIPNKKFCGSSGHNWANAIYGVFEDIDPHKISSQYTGGSIRYGVLGTYPCRTLTVSWYKVPNFSCYSSSNYWETYQIVLYEGTNVIDVYVNHRARCAGWNYGRGIIGIQNETGTKGLAAPGRNTTDLWAAEKEAWRFSPLSVTNYTITYYEGQGINGKVLGTGTQITINPREVSAITARLQFTAGNGTSFDLRDTALIVRSDPQIETTNRTICQGQSYTWYGKTYTQAGIYTNDIPDGKGCYAKIQQLKLTVGGEEHPTEYKTICAGSSYTWHGKTYSRSGTYYDINKTSTGCDSSYTLVLTINPAFRKETAATICQGESYTWMGRTYTQTGKYEIPYKTASGCDSILQLNLMVNKDYETSTESYLCDNEPFHWRGKTYSTAGIYYDSLISHSGCDSVFKLVLREAHSYYFEETQSICEGESLTWHGQTLTKEGTYYDYLRSIGNCDSTHVIHLKIAKKYLFVTEDGIRTGATYQWRGKTINQSGQYYDRFTSVDGCDSIYQLNLKYVKAYFYPKEVSICEGNTYTWRGRTFTEEGVYYDSLISRLGTDSIYQLHLTIEKPFHRVETKSICQGEQYDWHGNKYDKTGIYLDENKSRLGCDSTYELQLSVHPQFYQLTTGVLCNNDTYEWHGFRYSKPGIYFDTYKTQTGCDSIYELRLIAAKTYYFPSTATICDGEVYHWRGKEYSTTGIYYDSLVSINNCDSIYALTLAVGQHYLYEQTDSICQNDVYRWRGKIFNHAGIYYDSLVTELGCDSVYKLTLVMNDTYLFTTVASICEGEHYLWRGKEYSQTDMYYDRYVSTSGCDSVYTLILTVNPTYFYQETAYICSGNAFSWHGKEYTQVGIYYDTLQSVWGCDSIWELTLKMSENYFFEEEYSICDSMTYSWHGQTYSQPGIYYDHLQTAAGCDSTFKLTLTVLPTYWYSTDAVICSGDTFPWRDSVYATEGTHYDWLTTEQGCDSVFILNLKVNPRYLLKDSIWLCEGDSYEWHGHSYTQAGIYYDSLSTGALCDSIHQLTIQIRPHYMFILVDTICEGASYTWREHQYRQQGTYFDTLKTIYGCDSIYQLQLTVLTTYLFPISDTICKGQIYTWHNKDYDHSGIYYDSLLSSTGCDSVYQLQLFVAPTFHIQQRQLLCEKDTLDWHNQRIWQEGIFFDSLTTVTGCDSVYELNIQQTPSYHFEQSDTICDGDTYHFHGQDITLSGDYYAYYTTTYGCDSNYHLTLQYHEFPKPLLPIADVCADEKTICISYSPDIDMLVTYRISFGELAQQNGFKDSVGVLTDGHICIPLPINSQASYLTPNQYKATLELESSMCYETHKYGVEFNVLYPTTVVVQKFNDVLAVQNDKFNGGFIFSDFQWYVDGEVISGATGSYYYLPPALENKYYQVQLTRSADGVSMLTCPFYPITRTVLNQATTANWILSTIIPESQPTVQINIPNYPWTAWVYSIDGQLLTTYTSENHANATLQLPQRIGVYILRVQDNKNVTKSTQLIEY